MLYFREITVPKAILQKEKFVCMGINVYPVLKKCFSSANYLRGEENIVLMKTNVSFPVFASMYRMFNLELGE